MRDHGCTIFASIQLRAPRARIIPAALRIRWPELGIVGPTTARPVQALRCRGQDDAASRAYRMPDDVGPLHGLPRLDSRPVEPPGPAGACACCWLCAGAAEGHGIHRTGANCHHQHCARLTAPACGELAVGCRSERAVARCLAAAHRRRAARPPHMKMVAATGFKLGELPPRGQSLWVRARARTWALSPRDRGYNLFLFGRW